MSDSRAINHTDRALKQEQESPKSANNMTKRKPQDNPGGGGGDGRHDRQLSQGNQRQMDPRDTDRYGRRSNHNMSPQDNNNHNNGKVLPDSHASTNHYNNRPNGNPVPNPRSQDQGRWSRNHENRNHQNQGYQGHQGHRGQGQGQTQPQVVAERENNNSAQVELLQKVLTQLEEVKAEIHELKNETTAEIGCLRQVLDAAVGEKRAITESLQEPLPKRKKKGKGKASAENSSKGEAATAVEMTTDTPTSKATTTNTPGDGLPVESTTESVANTPMGTIASNLPTAHQPGPFGWPTGGYAPYPPGVAAHSFAEFCKCGGSYPHHPMAHPYWLPPPVVPTSFQHLQPSQQQQQQEIHGAETLQ